MIGAVVLGAKCATGVEIGKSSGGKGDDRGDVFLTVFQTFPA